MIIYNKKLSQFNSDVELNLIADELHSLVKSKGINVGKSEYNSWQNSLGFMKNVLADPEIDKDLQIAIEYQIPATSKRIDFIINGSDAEGKENLIIVELKQWSKVEKIDDESKHSVRTYTGYRNQNVGHPSYQAYSYKMFIQDNAYNEELLRAISVYACAYLHNYGYEHESIIKDPIYQEWLNEAPLFIKNEVINFRNYIKSIVKFEPKKENKLLLLEQSQFKPSKSLQDSLVSLVKGNKEFILLDDQIVVFDICISAMKKSLVDKKKRTIIIEGGPGTGKTVLAINILQQMISMGLNATYATKNSAPRQAFLHILTKDKTIEKGRIGNLFRSPFGLSKLKDNNYDCLIVDESHRLVEKMYRDWDGENQIKEIIEKSLVSIFFIDESQRITTKDIGKIDDIKNYAMQLGSELISNQDTILKSQFRCNGSDLYIQFVDYLLQRGETIQVNFKELNYDFRIYDDPNKMRDDLRSINSKNNKARIVAGYCYDWNVKNGRSDYDIFLENGFKAKWNLQDDKIWAINKNSFEEVGCIHTAQGLEFDYVGVIIGQDLSVDKNQIIITNQSKISKDDNTSGIRNTYKELAHQLILNTYKTLLTRGQKGCFVYCEDINLRNYIKNLLKI
jgi:hypothetical protein